MSSQDKHLAKALKFSIRHPEQTPIDLLSDLLNGKEPHSQEMPDDRASGRLGVQLPAYLAQNGKSRVPVPVMVTEVGISGMRVFSDIKNELKTEEVQVVLPRVAQDQRLKGRITWRKDHSGHSTAGIELTDEASYSWFSALSKIIQVTNNVIPAAGSR